MIFVLLQNIIVYFFLTACSKFEYVWKMSFVRILVFDFLNIYYVDRPTAYYIISDHTMTSVTLTTPKEELIRCGFWKKLHRSVRVHPIKVCLLIQLAPKTFIDYICVARRPLLCLICGWHRSILLSSFRMSDTFRSNWLHFRSTPVFKQGLCC